MFFDSTYNLCSKCSVNYQSESDLKVFVVDYESQADLKVYKLQ